MLGMRNVGRQNKRYTEGTNDGEWALIRMKRRRVEGERERGKRGGVKF